MSLHKLTAGSGYDYLTRQVAAMDATDKGHTGLASYYTEKGESPGAWVGSGLASIEGLSAGDVVTADHMQSLFGSGHHPLATQRTKELDQRTGSDEARRPTSSDYKTAVRLGTPYKVYAGDISPFRVEVAKRIAALNQSSGLSGDWSVPAAERAKIRTEVAAEFFRAEHGRDPGDARELAATIAKHSRPKTNAVAGYDLTFSPVKSVSVLWAISDPRTAAVIERAHQAALKDALDFIESSALFTRRGTNGVRQVDVRGLVATAFTHRDSRAGDPDLHTHVAVANKVQTLDGTWLAIDGRPLHKAVVSASETYNTALERHLVDALGVRFEERPNEDARKRSVREIVGVDPALNRRFSKRRLDVEDRRKVLAATFQSAHGRPPTPVETIQLSQQATLETREAKHEPRSLAEQREAWHREAVEVLGTPHRVKQMVHGALNPTGAARSAADAAWFAKTTDRIVATMEGGRSTWQYWHVYAEAQRQIRAADVPTNQVSGVVDLLVSEVLEGRSVSMARPWDTISEPVELRRADGSSVYTQAGADLFTSRRVLAAEQRLVHAAGRHDGYAVEASSVDLALLESTANGITLNAGQATLVREMATSGARLQLAIAPAGSGKTTAMRALASAWSDGGGTIIGLAPSAAAADALRISMGSQSGTLTDTLAKLTHSLEQARQTGTAMPDWVAGIDSSTLVVIDEAGMADTLSLDAAVSYILERGGSVRLIGDDQQLSAIGAGGVLRDIRATRGALQLGELVRFTDPAEGAASLALRAGKSEALGFYLDRDRVHVGDLTTMTEEVFAAWQADRAAGRDSIMLAPTRDLVSDLNRRARAHRLDGIGPAEAASSGPVRRLADGNEASLGELIITRENDRRLRTSATDWVKNGDRWIVLVIHDGGDLSVQHTQHGRTVRLRSDYVAKATELGYACTVHTAQGVTTDTMHALATGTESRQQLYTMMTRGAHANHVYLEVVGDGDPHSVIHPTLVQPLTPTDILESMLARDDAQRSATSLIREHADPATRLGEASQRYLDGLYVAAEDLLRHQSTTGVDGTTVNVVDALDIAVESLAPGLSDEAAWPTLRAHLLLLGAAGENPVEALRAAASDRELESARDRAAVLDWRLDASGMRNAGAGPLPWMPGIPVRLAEDPHWGAYLSQRAHLVEQLAEQVHTRAGEQSALPVWAQNGLRPEAATVADVEVWRAAMQVPVDDRRPTGAPQLQKASATWQRRLNRAVSGDHTPALAEWGRLLYSIAPQVRGDEFTPLLAERLAAMSRAGVTAHELLRTAAAPDHPSGPLPDEHASAALWWRMARHLTPAAAAQIGDGPHGENVTTDWAPGLADLFGPERAANIQASTWWPALVTNVDHALQRGWQVEALLGASRALPSDGGDDIDECQTLVCRTSISLKTTPDEQTHEYHFEDPPADMWEGIEPKESVFVDQPDGALWPPPEDPSTDLEPPIDTVDEQQIDVLEEDQVDADEDQYAESDLTLAAYLRDLGGTRLGPTEADIRLMCQRAEEWRSSPVTRGRMVEINELTQAFFEARFTDSWGRDYLTGRFGVDLAGDERFRPGQAPAGWTNLVDHLRGRGVSDTEMLATGVAVEASTGRLIDRFRDRVMFPVTHHGEVLGFVGRRRPDITDDDKAGPKYLNTADTPLFHKGAQLFGVVDELLAEGAVPVIVEGPTDTVAVTIASAGLYLGVAPLGTSLTKEQAAQLAAVGRDPIVATDPDLAGQVAAERDFWMLTPHGMDPGYARFPDGLDPADLLAQRGPAALSAAVASGQPAFRSLGDQLLTERLDNLGAEQARVAAMRVISARPSRAWELGVSQARARLQLPHLEARRDLRDAVKTWDADPRKAALAELHTSSQVRARLAAAADKTPAERWAPLARELDPRLLDQGDWPATAAMLQRAHEHGHDVVASTRAIVTETPLGDSPARDLRYRIVSRLGMPIDATPPLDNPATRQPEGERYPWPSPPTDRRMPPTSRR
ncbi:relaxase domain-containing protein [Nocardioides sp. dk4132]|uniref:MobF family relaxase n=1 Tax=unclassified Nocardioides TaxID=2615069 RepID=UPI0012967F8D|nr:MULTISPECIES: MobF family relaxase [unclassified Nocardioides]MQW77312.1 relaxase domain-containing protein [Nocardioides sp. dk4132]QGA08065.1 relaxase domain-containing protein [Nocardioides sp. dk884]